MSQYILQRGITSLTWPWPLPIEQSDKNDEEEFDSEEVDAMPAWYTLRLGETGILKTKKWLIASFEVNQGRGVKNQDVKLAEMKK